MKQLASLIAASLAGAAALSAFAGPSEGMILRCDFDPVEEAGQPARHVEVRLGAWDDDRDPLGMFEDGEPVRLWVEEGVPDCPVWPPSLHIATSGLTFQHWGCGDVMNMLTFDARDGRAVLSTHAAEGNPPRTLVSTTVGMCTISEGE